MAILSLILLTFDARGKAWDFRADCSKSRHLEKFADTLIGFNSRKSNRNATEFWEDSAQSIFAYCAMYLQKYEQYSIQELRKIICQSSQEELRKYLQSTALLHESNF